MASPTVCAMIENLEHEIAGLQLVTDHRAKRDLVYVKTVRRLEVKRATLAVLRAADAWAQTPRQLAAEGLESERLYRLVLGLSEAPCRP